MVTTHHWHLSISVTSKKLPIVYKSCPKMISLENWKIMTPLQKLTKNVADLGKIIVATVCEKLQLIAQSGHTGRMKSKVTIVEVFQIRKFYYLASHLTSFNQSKRFFSIAYLCYSTICLWHLCTTSASEVVPKTAQIITHPCIGTQSEKSGCVCICLFHWWSICMMEYFHWENEEMSERGRM